MGGAAIIWRKIKRPRNARGRVTQIALRRTGTPAFFPVSAHTPRSPIVSPEHRVEFRAGSRLESPKLARAGRRGPPAHLADAQLPRHNRLAEIGFGRIVERSPARCIPLQPLPLPGFPDPLHSLRLLRLVLVQKCDRPPPPASWPESASSR